MKNTLLFIYSTNILVRLLTVNMKNCMWLSWKCDPIQRHIPINLLKGSTFETTQLIFNFFVNRNWKKLTDSRKGAKILVDNLITVKEPLLSRAVVLIRFSPSRPPQSPMALLSPASPPPPGAFFSPFLVASLRGPVLGLAWKISLSPTRWDFQFGTSGFSFRVPGQVWFLQEGLNGVNRPPSKKVFIYRQPSKMQTILSVKSLSKSFKLIQSPYFSWSSRTSGSWRISKLEKPFPMFPKTLSLDITRPSYNLLISENISTFHQVKGQDNLS